MAEITQRQKVVLAALASHQSKFAPVQVQKLFFLLDENIAQEIGGRQFKFRPYDYGPFDSQIYSELGALSRAGLVTVEEGYSSGRRRYFLTPEGAALGGKLLAEFPARARDYMASVSAWIQTLNFAQLVGSIYKQYPAMKANSIFREG